MFAELASRLTEKDGFAAIIAKSALVTSTCYSSCFRHFVNQGSLSEVFLFDNREKLFQIDSREKFCVLFFGGEHAGGIKVHYGLTKQEQILSSVPINVTSEELELTIPETGLLPNDAIRRSSRSYPSEHTDRCQCLQKNFQSVILVGWYTLLRMQNTFLQSRKKHESQSMRENSSNNMIIVFPHLQE